MKIHIKNTVGFILAYILVGALVVIGMRTMEIIWPEKAAKATIYVCFSGNEGIEACKIFKNGI